MIDNVITAIDRVAAEHPTRVAYDYEGTQYTYAQLKEGSDRLAGFFAESLPAGEPIIVYGGQTFDMVEVFLGLSKSGHAYIPIDTHSPNERITQVQDVAHAPAVIEVAPLPITVPDVKIIRHRRYIKLSSHTRQFIHCSMRLLAMIITTSSLQAAQRETKRRSD